jgi:hypothetical protein
MDILLVVIGVIAALYWVFFHKPSMHMLKQENAWFETQDIIEEVYAKTYIDEDLVKNLGANIVLGIGKKKDNSNVGYIYEIIPGGNIVEAVILEPPEIATNPIFIENAKMNGLNLIDSLKEFHKKKDNL